MHKEGPVLRRMLLVDILEMGLKVYKDAHALVSHGKNSDPQACTFNCNLWGILSLSITGDIISDFDTPVELFHQQIVLVQEQYDLGTGQDLIR